MPHATKERSREYHADWYSRNKATLARKRRERRERDRADALVAYGGKCACCGETEALFLTFDHINGDGAAHRREMRLNSVELCSWLRKQGYPDDFRVLCFNCNCGRDRNGGVCPHERIRA